MRTAILFGLILIADAIKPIHYGDESMNMIAGIVILFFVFDVFDFFYKQKSK